MLKVFRSLTVASALFCASMGIASAEVVFNRGNSADPESLDPHKTSTVYEAHILRDLFLGLTTEDAKAEIIPGAAESWTVSDDGKVYTFKLRADGKWSDGTPVTANDFVFSWRRLVDPATAAEYAYMLAPVVNAEADHQGREEARGTGRQGRRRSDLRGHAQRADALFPRNADPPGDLCGEQGQCREVRRRLHQARQSRVERRLHARRVRAQRSHQGRQESEFL